MEKKTTTLIGNILLLCIRKDNKAAQGKPSRGRCGTWVIFSDTPRPDIWRLPATICHLPWRWPALSLSYLSPGFFLGRSWQWCHHLMMLLGDLVRWAGFTHYSCTLKLNRGKNFTKNQGEEVLRLCKGVAPWAPSPDFQTLITHEKLYLTQFLGVLRLEKS